MASSWITLVCTAVALCFVANEGLAFLTPSAPMQGVARHLAAAAPAASQEGAKGSWGAAAAATIALGANAGLAAALRSRSTRRAVEKKAKEAKPEKYVESAADQRLFEQVYHEYTREYLKGPMYWHEDKLQGIKAPDPGNPLVKNGKLTSNNLGTYKNFSSDELTYISFLFFSIGLYGNLQFQIYDQQWATVQMGGNFNVSYIVESFFLLMSFPLHILAYIQRQNGK